MKKYILYSIICCVAALFVACSDNEPAADLNADPAQVTIAAAGDAAPLTINTSVAWEITKPADAAWLVITPSRGTGMAHVSLSALENTSASERSTNLLIKAGNLTYSVSVKQSAPPASNTLPADGGAITGDNTNNCPYTASVVLKAAPIANAASYQWYHNGSKVAQTTAATYAASATGAYTVAGVNNAGTGSPGPEKRITIATCPLPEAAAAITGDNVNVCPKSTVRLSIDPIANAVSYQWYKNGTPIARATATTYSVTSSGTYTVAGVNGAGEGPKSPAKEMALAECPSIAGAWSGSGWDFFETKAIVTWDETIVKQDGYFTLTNFTGEAGMPPFVIVQDADENYYLQSFDIPIGSVTIPGGTYDLYQVIGAYTNRQASQAYMLTGGIKLEYSADGKSLKLPATIQLNVSGVLTDLVPAFGSKFIAGGSTYWYNCMGELSYTKKAAGAAPQEMPVTIIKNPDFQPQPLKVVEMATKQQQ